MHTIAWGVIDDHGAGQGIGSRYFTVANAGSVTPQQPSGWVPRESLAASVGAPAPAAGTIALRTGYDEAGAWTTLTPGPTGVFVVGGTELERLEIELGPDVTAGAELVGTRREPLPIGSTLANGVFSWQPGVGFIGSYLLAFDRAGGAPPLTAAVTLAPKFVKRTAQIQLAIDTPQAGGVVPLPFLVAGWALDRSAMQGPGVDAVHVWAYPVTGGAPFFLGVATLGGTRPDVGAAFGAQFIEAGYGLEVDALPPGTYDLAVFPHSAVTGAFEAARTVRVVIK